MKEGQLTKDTLSQDPVESAREKLDRKRITEYQKLFSSPTGRWVLLDMCRAYGVLVGISSDNLDPQALAYDAGKQRPVIDILHKLNTNPIMLRQEMAESNG